MGLTAKILKFQEKIIQKIGLRWEEIRICELGSQCMRIIDIPAKRYYIEEKKVLEHTSIDWNGMFNSLVIDLRFPVPEKLLNRFHLITDFGTIEHVDNQYQVFKNVHDMCTINGAMIHILPSLNYWKYHCQYFYSDKFLVSLAKLCNYKILSLETKNAYNPPLPKSSSVFAAFFKQNNNGFISMEKFNELERFNLRDLNNTIGDSIERSLWKVLRLRRYILLAYRKIYSNKYFKNYKKRRN